MLEAGRELAKKIASLSPLVVQVCMNSFHSIDLLIRSLQGTKMVLNYSEEHNIKDSLEHVALWNSAFIQSSDLGKDLRCPYLAPLICPQLGEAMSAFIEKRPGVFRNRL